MQEALLDNIMYYTDTCIFMHVMSKGEKNPGNITTALDECGYAHSSLDNCSY